jgi:hypothetical protein
MGLVTAIAVGSALLILTIVSVTVGMRKTDKSAARMNGGPVSVFVASLAYAIVLTPVIAPDGLNLPTMVLLVVLVALPPIISGLFQRTRAHMGESARRAFDIVGVIASFALLVGILATAGAVLSLMGGVNRYLVIAVIGFAVAAYLLACGRLSANRTSRWALVMAFFIPVLLLVGGAALGSPVTIAEPLVPSTELGVGSAFALLFTVVAMGFVDPAIGQVLRAVPNPSKTALWGAAVPAAFVFVFSLGLILLYGGAFVAPSLQAFLLAALPAVGIGFFLFFAAFVLASAADTQLAAASEAGAALSDPSRRQVVSLAIIVVAVVVAMLLPATGQIFIVAALIAAATFGAVLPILGGGAPDLQPVSGIAVGVVGGIAIALLLGVESALAFESSTAVGLLVAFLLAGTTSLVVAKRPAAEAMSVAD